MRLLLAKDLARLVRLGQHEVEDELLAPEYDALDDVEREHAQAVQDIDALLEKTCIGPAV